MNTKVALAGFLLLWAMNPGQAISEDTIPGEPSARSDYWVVGSVSDVDTAQREQTRIGDNTGMIVTIVPAVVNGAERYRLVVKAAESASNRVLQKTNLQYFGVGEPWLMTLSLHDLPSTDGDVLDSTVDLMADEPEFVTAPETSPAYDMEAETAAVPQESVAEPVMSAPAPIAAPMPAPTIAAPVQPQAPTASPATKAEQREPEIQRPEPIATRPVAISTPTSTADEFHAGMASFKQRDYQTAIDRFTDALSVDSDNGSIYYNRGLAHARLKDHESAINDYSEAIALNPEFSDAYDARGVAWRKMDDSEKALRDFTRALELDSGNMSARLHRSSIHFLQIFPVIFVLLAP